MEAFILRYPFPVVAVVCAALSVMISGLLTSKGFFEGHIFRGLQGLIFLFILYGVMFMELVMIIAPMGPKWTPQQLWLVPAVLVSSLCLRAINRVVKRHATEPECLS